MTWFSQSEKSVDSSLNYLHLVACLSLQEYFNVQECREAVVDKIHIPVKPEQFRSPTSSPVGCLRKQ